MEFSQKEIVYVVGHKHPDTDSIASAIAYAHLKNLLGESLVQPARTGALNAETRFVLQRFSLPIPELLTSGAGLRLILVDHNEVAQAVDDIDKATILEVWEHHRIGDLQISQPIVFHCEPVGATATLIAEQYFAHNIVPPSQIAGILLAAILSDTLIFSSPTCTEKDRDIARRLEVIAGVDAADFGRELIGARGDASELPPREIVETDFKEFRFEGNRVGIAQVEMPSAEKFLARRQKLVDELRRIREEKGLLQVLLMVTDIGKKGSYVWFAGSRRDILEKALGKPLTDEGVYMEGWMSRKKQMAPALERAFASSLQPEGSM
jgi:manganese-dependent inorganic pyrophosphatase